METAQEKYEKALKEAEAQYKIDLEKAEVIKNLPSFLEPASSEWRTLISEHVAYADFHVHFQAETLEDALIMAEKANPLQLFFIRKGCVKICTEKYFDKEDKEKAEAEPTWLPDYIKSIHPYYLNVSGLRGHKELVELVFFFMVGEKVVKASVEIMKHVQMREYDYTKFGKLKYCELIENSGHFNYTVRLWATDNELNSFYRMFKD